MTVTLTADAQKVRHHFIGNVTRQNNTLYDKMLTYHPDGAYLCGDALIEDCWLRLFKPEPQWVQAVPDPGDEPIFEALKRLEASGEFERLRRDVPTVLDPLYSLLAAEGVAKVVRDAALGIVAAREGGYDIGGFPTDGIEKIQRLEDFAQEAHEFEEEIGFGGHGQGHGESGEPSDLQIQQAMQFMQVLRTPQMIRTIDFFGQFEIIARNQGKLRSDIQPTKITGITRGNDLQRLTSYGYMKLVSPLLRPIGMKDYHNRALPEYERKVNATKGRGPMLILKDISGSMDADKMATANAACLLLRKQAFRQKRDYSIMPFHDSPFGLANGNRWVTVPRNEARPCYWPKGKPEASQFLSVFTQGAAGGTDGYNAFKGAWWALDNFPMEQNGITDIVMATDGFCGMRPHALTIREECAKRKIQVWFLLVEHSDEGEARMITDADKIIRLDNVLNKAQQEHAIGRLMEIGGSP